MFLIKLFLLTTDLFIYFYFLNSLFQTQRHEKAAVRKHHCGILLLWRADPVQDLGQRKDRHARAVQGAAYQERVLQVKFQKQCF